MTLHAQPRLRVLVAGALTRDFNIVHGQSRQAPGGAPMHAGTIYARNGVPLTLAFASAPAEALQLAREIPDADIRHQPDPKSCVFENAYGSHGRRDQRLLTTAAPLELPGGDALAQSDLLHLSPLHHHDLHPDWYSLAHGNVALDVQGLTRQLTGTQVRPVLSPQFRVALHHVRFIKASAREWALIASSLGLKIDAVVARGVELLITDGAAGGHWHCADGSSGYWRAHGDGSTGTDVDPTGAGDAFFAAYLCQRVGNGLDCREAADCAARYVGQELAGRPSAYLSAAT